MAKNGLKKKTRVANHILTVVFSLVSILYLYPLVMMVFNSFKKKAFISRAPFALPTDKMFAGCPITSWAFPAPTSGVPWSGAWSSRCCPCF